MKELSPSLYATKVCDCILSEVQMQGAWFRSLSKVFDIAASRSDVVVVDCDLDREDRFALSPLETARSLFNCQQIRIPSKPPTA